MEMTAVSPPVRRRWLARRRLLKLIVVLPLAWVGYCAVMYFCQDRFVFPRELAPKPTPSRGVDAANVITIRTEDGCPVEGWFIPAPNASAAHPAPAVLYFHGNAEVIDRQRRVPPMWAGLGVSLLMVEYRGYGRAESAGPPSQEGLVADGDKFYQELIRRPDVDPSRVIVHGYSMGGGVASQVAARHKPAVLVLEATFTNLADIAWHYGTPPFLARYPFRTDEVLPRLGVPIFIAHGRADRIVPVWHGRRLHALVPGSTYVELDCGHLNLPGAKVGDPYTESLRAFLVANHILPARPMVAAEDAARSRPHTE